MNQGRKLCHLQDLLAGLAILSLAHLAAAGAVQTYMVPMRDGAKLATDVYLPTGQGPWPTFLARTPYEKSWAWPGLDPANWTPKTLPQPQDLTGRGYAVVIQDGRGFYASEGANSSLWYKFFGCHGWGELQDGYDTVEWIVAQNWSNGKVGTYGGSALGCMQNLMAGSYPPHLVCQYIPAAAWDIYSHYLFRGGVPLKFLLDYLGPPQTSSYDSTWEVLNCSTRVAGMTYPGFHVTGWYDLLLQGTINGFADKQHNGGTGSKGNQKLVIGPWFHEGLGGSVTGELTFPPNSAYDMWPDTFLFYDYWLKGTDNGYTSLPAVRYYVMGDVDDPTAPGNEWRSADDWPVKHTDISLYLSEGGLGDRPGVGGAKSYLYDPNDPVPDVGGTNIVLWGPADVRKVEEREDVLVFSTAPLEVPVEVTGRALVDLYASSSCPDTDFMARLTDVYPDGRSMLVMEGAIRARHRNSMSSEEFMDPDSVYEFTIDLSSTSIVFNKGHRIRVDITSSICPRFDPNPNTGHPLRADAETRVANNTVYFGGPYRSRIILPLAGPDSDGDGLYDVLDPFPYQAGPHTVQDVAKAIQDTDLLIASVKDQKLRGVLEEASRSAKTLLEAGDLVGSGHFVPVVGEAFAFDTSHLSVPEARRIADKAMDLAMEAAKQAQYMAMVQYLEEGWKLGSVRQIVETLPGRQLLADHLSEAEGLMDEAPLVAVGIADWCNQTGVQLLAAQITCYEQSWPQIEKNVSQSNLKMLQAMFAPAKTAFVGRDEVACQTKLQTFKQRLVQVGVQVCTVDERAMIVGLALAALSFCAFCRSGVEGKNVARRSQCKMPNPRVTGS